MATSFSPVKTVVSACQIVFLGVDVVTQAENTGVADLF